eukprot:CAMPEP_0185702090 /NCGR_PEP_ID=MMETSP1164-20130828/11118_1 /TAXON_ID=1104430 /ORGANISM="Chrysoreinhardia sp, Strain CCMP2950" /LENGTH=181 /DNA_ID=CAMNT_0028369249 /DNA_START=1 /DNA_END=543 /DNA_ORIENTATION=-
MPDAAPPSTGQDEATVILLCTSVPSSTIIDGNQTFVRQVFTGRKIPYVEIDGMDATRKDERNALFALSTLRGKYPQVFVRRGAETTFVGDFDKINELNDCEQLPEEILTANPQIETISKVFAPFLAPSSTTADESSRVRPLRELSEDLKEQLHRSRSCEERAPCGDVVRKRRRTPARMVPG